MTATSEFEDFFYTSQDGLKLHARIYGKDNEAAMPVVCLPGLTRNVRDFHDIALYLSRDAKTPRKVISFDYRGRGQSDYDPDWKKYDVGVETGDILVGLAALGVSKAAFIGTSRGGIITHVMAAIRPDILGAIVLNDIGPVLETKGLALIQSYLGTPLPRPKSLKEAAETQKRLHSAAFTDLNADDWVDFALAIYREENGEFIPDYDPNLLNGLLSLDLSQPLPNLWPQFEAMAKIPVMVIRGANSQLLSADQVNEMAQRHAGLVVETVANQGHAPLLHRGSLPQRITEFLDRATA